MNRRQKQIPKTPAKARQPRSRVLSVPELDQLLDVPADRFPATVKKLALRFQREDLDLDVSGYRDSLAVSANLAGDDYRDGMGGFYRADIRRLPPMDRAEEFRMARRYEFLRGMAATELERLGLAPKDALVWAGRPRTQVARLLERWLRRVPARCVPDAAGRRRLDRLFDRLGELRNLYVEGALHIVLGAVHRYRGLGVDVADLIQDGNASLFQAIEGFDWRRDVRFRTYAQYWVQQAILKLLYNSARTVRIPIWVQKLLGKIRRAQNTLRREGREATIEEVAEHLALPAERVEWILSTRRYAASLDATLPGDAGGTLAALLPDDRAESVPDTVSEGDLGASLATAMADLPDRERMILRRRYGLDGREPETLGAIAADLGITAERVRQLQNAAMGRMQKPAAKARLQRFAPSA